MSVSMDKAIDDLITGLKGRPASKGSASPLPLAHLKFDPDADIAKIQRPGANGVPSYEDMLK